MRITALLEKPSGLLLLTGPFELAFSCLCPAHKSCAPEDVHREGLVGGVCYGAKMQGGNAWLISYFLILCDPGAPSCLASPQGLTVAFVESMTTQLQNFPAPPGPTDPFWCVHAPQPVSSRRTHAVAFAAPRCPRARSEPVRRVFLPCCVPAGPATGERGLGEGAA